MVPGDAVLPARNRLELVPPEDHSAVLGFAVDEVVGIAEARHVPRELVTRDCLERDVLVIDGGRGDASADHRGDLRGPHARRVDDDLRVDRAPVGDDAADIPARREFEAGDPDALTDPDAEAAGRLSYSVRRTMRIKVTIAR